PLRLAGPERFHTRRRRALLRAAARSSGSAAARRANADPDAAPASHPRRDRFAHPAGDQPQHIFSPSSAVFEGKPCTGLSVMSWTPVPKKSSPGFFAGFLPDLANSATASTPLAAISKGNCIEVAPMTPDLTFLTPGQPPSIETMSVPLSLPTAFSAS